MPASPSVNRYKVAWAQVDTVTASANNARTAPSLSAYCNSLGPDFRSCSEWPVQRVAPQHWIGDWMAGLGREWRRAVELGAAMLRSGEGHYASV